MMSLKKNICLNCELRKQAVQDAIDMEKADIMNAFADTGGCRTGMLDHDEMFEVSWHSGHVKCNEEKYNGLESSKYAQINQRAPKFCPYSVEHLLL
jgi:hypothetical protein